MILYKYFIFNREEIFNNSITLAAMKQLILVVFVIFASMVDVLGQGGILKPQGARSAALAQNAETFKDLNALFHNQAGLGFIESAGGILSLERRFMLQGLQHASMGFALPVQQGQAFGFTMQYFGNTDYSEIKIGAAYGRKLQENISIGAQVDYIGVQIREGGSEGVVTFEGGVLARLTDNILLGVHVFSPVGVRFSNDYRLPTIFRMSTQIEVSPTVSIFAGADKDIEEKENLKFGVEYNYLDKASFRIGTGTYPTAVSFGFGFKALSDAMIIDFAAQWNQLLGYTPALTLGYEF